MSNPTTAIENCAPLSAETKAELDRFIESHDGRVYAPVLHPDYASVPAMHGSDRFDVFAPYLSPKEGTALDIGANWGYIAFRLEQLGYDVTAVEMAAHVYPVLKELRDACNMKFKTVYSSVFEMENMNFDVVVALNIFHHFLKKPDRFENFIALLDRLECQTLIFQSHRETEPQMKTSYKNFAQDDFAQFVSEKSGLSNIKLIDTQNRRNIYALTAGQ